MRLRNNNHTNKIFSDDSRWPYTTKDADAVVPIPTHFVPKLTAPTVETIEDNTGKLALQSET